MSDLNYNVTFREKDKGWQCIVSYKDTLGKWQQRQFPILLFIVIHLIR